MMGEDDLWSKLPNELVASILSRLSVFDIVRAACTCRRLRALFLPSSQQQQQPRFSSSAHVTTLLLFDPFAFASPQDVPDLALWVYDSGRNSWLKLSLAFLQPYIPTSSQIVASDGGLLCIGSGRDFVVCNPITKSFSRLPQVGPFFPSETGPSYSLVEDEDYVPAFGMVHDSLTATYDLFLICFRMSAMGEQDMIMTCYRSSILQWTELAPCLVLTGPPWQLFSSGLVACHSKLYSLWKKWPSVVILEFASGSWNVIESPYIRAPLLKAFLLDFQGSLHMVGFVGALWLHDDVWERPTHISIWKLQGGRIDWTEVTRMPFSVLHEFRRNIDFCDLRCWGKNGIMYMQSFRSKVLMLDLNQNGWYWLKDLEVDLDLVGSTFEPCVSAHA